MKDSKSYTDNIFTVYFNVHKDKLLEELQEANKLYPHLTDIIILALAAERREFEVASLIDKLKLEIPDINIDEILPGYTPWPDGNPIPDEFIEAICKISAKRCSCLRGDVDACISMIDEGNDGPSLPDFEVTFESCQDLQEQYDSAKNCMDENFPPRSIEMLIKYIRCRRTVDSLYRRMLVKGCISI